MIAVLGLLPLACSSCFLGEEGLRWAYYVSTVIMMVLPFAWIGGAIRWLRRSEPDPLVIAPSPEAGGGRPALWALSAAVGVIALVVWLNARSAQDAHAESVTGEPAVLAQIEPFTLVDQTGASLGTDDLSSRVWIANFVFTRCPTVCPTLTRKMAEVQHRTDHVPSIRLLSFTVDPTHDTPEVLAGYAKTYGADPKRWSFLTGPLDAVERAVEQGLKVNMGDLDELIDLGSVLHGTRFVLVDGLARIRGYYDVAKAEGMDALLRDAEQLLNQSVKGG